MTIFYENTASASQQILSMDFNPEELCEKLLRHILMTYECEYEASVNLYFVDEEEIQQVNEEYRQIPKVTDVLSFPNLNFEEPGDFSFLDTEGDFDSFDPESGELLLGDIMICYKRMCEQATEYGHSLLRECAFLITHSLLHLLGYDHMEVHEREEMEALQKRFLQELSLGRDCK